MKIAVIDIGSNSVRLMMWADGTTLYKALKTTRLGEGIAHSPLLKEEAIMRTAQAVCDFASQAAQEGADATYAFATAAVRSAENGAVFCERVKELCGIDVDVVSGETEAELAVLGALGGKDGAIIDIGGASTEVCIREGGYIRYLRSFPVGAVRLKDLCGDTRDRLAEYIPTVISPLAGVKVRGETYAVGGTATTLAACKLCLKEYDPVAVQNLYLTRREVEALSERLLGMTTEERMTLAGMDVRRADIIAGGAYLLARVMELLSLEGVTVSDSDNLEGYLAWRKKS